MNQRIEQLKKEIAELMEFKRLNSIVQIKYPLGNDTTRIVQTDIPVFTGTVDATPPVFNISLEVSVNGFLYWISAKAI